MSTIIEKNLPRDFFTCVHNFAQSFSAICVDGEMRREYLARQIEPGSLKNFTAQFKRRSKLQSRLRRELNREARSFTEHLEKRDGPSGRWRSQMETGSSMA
jgi:hypothetical protein